MKLSMWIVKEWLEKYEPEAHIQDGSRMINGVRYMSEDIELNKEYLYIGNTDQFITRDSRNIICVNSTDIIMLKAPDMYTIFNEIQQMLEFYNNWEMKLLQAVNDNLELTELLSLAAPVLKCSMAITDISHKLLAESILDEMTERKTLINGYLPFEELRDINTQLQEYTDVHSPYVICSGLSHDVIRNLYLTDHHLCGWLTVLGGGDVRELPCVIQLTEAFSTFLDLWLRINPIDHSKSNVFLDILKNEEYDSQLVDFQMKGIGWNRNDPMRLFVIKACHKRTLNLSLLYYFLERLFPCICSFYYNEDLVSIMNLRLSGNQNIYEDFQQLLRKNDVYSGASYIFEDIFKIHSCFQQAILAAKYGRADSGMINSCEEYALEYMERKFSDAVEIDIASPALEILKKQDAENGTEYYKTLEVYLRCERDQTRTAKELSIHRNSLVYRIKKIESMIPVNLNDDRQRLYLSLSYILKRN